MHRGVLGQHITVMQVQGDQLGGSRQAISPVKLVKVLVLEGL